MKARKEKMQLQKLKEKETGNGKLKILDVLWNGFFTILLANRDTGNRHRPYSGYDHKLPDPCQRRAGNMRLPGDGCGAFNFQDESFDVVISRNLTWTLPEAAQAYKEWSRVLKPGGLLLNLMPTTAPQTSPKPPISRKTMPTTSLEIP